MRTDEIANAVYFDFPIQLRKSTFHKIGNCPGVLITGRVRDVAFAAVIKTVLCMFLHLFNDLFDHSLLGSDFVAWDQAAEIIHVEQGADFQKSTYKAGSFCYTASLDIEGKVCGEEPVMQIQPMGKSKLLYLVDGLSFISQISQFIHQKTVTGRSAQRVNDVDLAVRIFFAKDIGSGTGGVVYAGDTAGQRDVENVQTLFKEASEIGFKLTYTDLGSLGFSAVCHCLIELGKWDRLTKIVQLFLSVQRIMKTDIMNSSGKEVLIRQISRRTAAENKIKGIRHDRAPHDII